MGEETHLCGDSSQGASCTFREQGTDHSGLCFPGRFYGKQPWKIEVASPSEHRQVCILSSLLRGQRSGRFIALYTGVGFCSLPVVHLNYSLTWNLRLSSNYDIMWDDLYIFLGDIWHRKRSICIVWQNNADGSQPPVVIHFKCFLQKEEKETVYGSMLTIVLSRKSTKLTYILLVFHGMDSIFIYMATSFQGFW